MRKTQYLDYLSRTPFFEGFAKKDLTAIARHAETIDIEPGMALVREGQTGREFFVIAQGTATIQRGGRKIAKLGPGDAFGELSLLVGAKRNATVRADTRMTVVVLGQREFLGTLQDSPQLAFKLLKQLATRLYESDTSKVK